MPKSITTEAFVIRQRKLPSKDNIVTLFTHDVGKISVLAKGIKSITSRRLSHTQTLNLITVVLRKHHDYWYLNETSLISAFSTIKNDEAKANLMYLLVYVLDRLLPDSQQELEIYRKTKKFITEIAKSTDDLTGQWSLFLNNLMQVLGYSQNQKSITELYRIIEELTNEKIPLRII